MRETQAEPTITFRLSKTEFAALLRDARDDHRTVEEQAYHWFIRGKRLQHWQEATVSDDEFDVRLKNELGQQVQVRGHRGAMDALRQLLHAWPSTEGAGA